MNLQKIITGGFLSKHKMYILSGVGVLSATASYLVGDSDLFITLESIFTVYGIYLLGKSTKKGK